MIMVQSDWWAVTIHTRGVSNIASMEYGGLFVTISGTSMMQSQSVCS